MSLFILTRQERQVILFLILVALVGLGVNFLSKYYSKIKVIGYIYDDVSKANLNKATRETLIDLPGIGEKLAERIIDYRKQNGKFREVIELKNIKGISKSRYETIKGYFVVEDNGF